MAVSDPSPEPLSAKFESSFAYVTVNSRMPIILTRVIDTLHRMKDDVLQEHGEEGTDELKKIVGCLSKLRNELLTNKPILPLADNRSDTAVWNAYLQQLTAESTETPPQLTAESTETPPPSWYQFPWLYVECYMYRRVQEAVELSTRLRSLDVFQEQKHSSLTSSYPGVSALMMHLMMTSSDLDNKSSSEQRSLFRQFMQASLWANKRDLCAANGLSNDQTSNIIEQLKELEPFILLDDVDQVWDLLQKVKDGSRRVDFVLDNAGFELASDLCLAEFLLASGIATSIHFHIKAMPWFISDVTSEDFHWTLETFLRTNHMAMSRFGAKWKGRIQDGSWKLIVHDFWSLPFSYDQMTVYGLDLYQNLANSDFVFLKGDLNYRKLVGDLNLDPTIPFLDALRGFHPTPLCVLRSIKSDVVAGLKPGQAEETKAKDSDWMIQGNWGVISFCDKVVTI